VIACGTPEQLIQTPESHTGRFLKPILQNGQQLQQAGANR